jgi:drug/metabolite transporter (DMT)-like permease
LPHLETAAPPPPPFSSGVSLPVALTKPVRGSLWMVISILCFTVMTTSVRLLSDHMPASEMVLLRSIIAMALVLPMLLRKGLAGLYTSRAPLHAYRGLFTGLGTFTWFYAVGLIPLADAVALHFTLPLFGFVMAIVYLKEAVNRHRWVTMAVGFSGALVILRPGFTEVNFIALVVLFSAVVYAAGSIIGKMLVATDPPATVVFYLNLFIGLLVLPLALFQWVPPAPADIPAILAIGVSAGLAHFCLARAFFEADASFILSLDFLRLPVTAAAAYVLFAEIPDLWTVAGAAIIFGSTWYLNWHERGAR